ncbi:hypothetical protein L227DRAFT_361280 [Lentinus tigrinus ALCF2SS1-6]|uniref:F-box domain-containing protein n=1 Tax=Lentinus tigrinus ALCF2SS1-6 TaxID=1328759 RepID=A0A5C2SIZ5_9APHY|nr:hypothetical protein L227DRAFT_361280 [Lentinus tigrinus ALCF2SS1-6]
MVFLPTKLWQHIFSFSCTDGGYTGASLSLASKAFRAHSAAYRLQTVRLSSLDSIEKFLYCKSFPFSHSVGLHVRHLTLSLGRDCNLTWTYDPFGVNTYSLVYDAWSTRFFDVMCRLFDVLHDELETMVILKQTDTPLPHLDFSFQFSRLRSLTLVHNGSLFVRADVPGYLRSCISYDRGYGDVCALDDGPGCEEDSTFPVLESLHVIDCTWDEASVSAWAASAPSLTELYLPGATEEVVWAAQDAWSNP